MPKREDAYPDPDDLQFGKSAAEKEEAVDDALERGAGAPSEEEEQESPPRAGNKARPSGDT